MLSWDSSKPGPQSGRDLGVILAEIGPVCLKIGFFSACNSCRAELDKWCDLYEQSRMVPKLAKPAARSWLARAAGTFAL
jgi:hypothetical protein